ncbi:hypothetical protein IG631_15682 [Alternaria alternata]|nr:hypothetical protein IG631_15682 [Alternaria alternata]
MTATFDEARDTAHATMPTTTAITVDMTPREEPSITSVGVSYRSGRTSGFPIMSSLARPSSPGHNPQVDVLPESLHELYYI